MQVLALMSSSTRAGPALTLTHIVIGSSPGFSRSRFLMVPSALHVRTMLSTRVSASHTHTHTPSPCLLSCFWSLQNHHISFWCRLRRSFGDASLSHQRLRIYKLPLPTLASSITLLPSTSTPPSSPLHPTDPSTTLFSVLTLVRHPSTSP